MLWPCIKGQHKDILHCWLKLLAKRVGELGSGFLYEKFEVFREFYIGLEQLEIELKLSITGGKGGNRWQKQFLLEQKQQRDLEIACLYGKRRKPKN